MKDMLIILLGGVVFFAAILWGAFAVDEAGCAVRWKDSGRKSDWSIKGGCRVEDKNGRLVPEKVIRDVQ
jgi:hypothetical protein